MVERISYYVTRALTWWIPKSIRHRWGDKLENWARENGADFSDRLGSEG